MSASVLRSLRTTASRSPAHRFRVPALRAFRPSRRVVLVLLLALGLLIGGWFIVRDSSLVAVRKVTVTGASGSQAGRIRAALTDAALNMTTLDVHSDVLLKAARAFPGVLSISVQAHFPHGLTIAVRQLTPVAAILTSDGRRTPVAGDGTLLPVAVSSPLPSIAAPDTKSGGRLTNTIARAEALILSAVPAGFRGRVSQASYERAHGYVVVLRHGPTAWFGGTGALADKWAALVRVLAFGSVAGASYIDVTVPHHPVAGGLSGGPAAPSDVPDASADAPSAPAGPTPTGQNQPSATPVG